ncbi:MAG: glycosyltransferase family 4 protein [Candidatus Woesearchaeota archaeon]
MKIGMVSNFPPEEVGLVGYSEKLTKELKKQVKVITIGSLNSNADYKINLGSLFLKRKLKGIIKKEKLNLLHFQYIAPLYGMFFKRYPHNLGLYSCLFLKIPKVFTLHEIQDPNYSSFEKLKRTLLRSVEKGIIKKSNYIIVPIESHKEHFKKKYGKEEIAVIPFPSITNIPIQDKKNVKNLLYFGMISPGKGVEYLIQAMDNLGNFNLQITGKFIDLFPEYKEKILHLIGGKENIQTTFRWISEEEKIKLFKKSDILILPFKSAPWNSGTAMDGPSCGIPTIITKIGSAWEVIEEFKVGEVVEPHNPEAIIEAVQKISKDYSKYQKNIELFKKTINFDNIAKRHLEIYQKIAVRFS